MLLLLVAELVQVDLSVLSAMPLLTSFLTELDADVLMDTIWTLIILVSSVLNGTLTVLPVTHQNVLAAAVILLSTPLEPTVSESATSLAALTATTQLFATCVHPTLTSAVIWLPAHVCQVSSELELMLLVLPVLPTVPAALLPPDAPPATTATDSTPTVHLVSCLRTTWDLPSPSSFWLSSPLPCEAKTSYICYALLGHWFGRGGKYLWFQPGQARDVKSPLSVLILWLPKEK